MYGRAVPFKSVENPQTDQNPQNYRASDPLFCHNASMALASRAAWSSKKSTANNQYQGPTPIQTIKSKYQQKHKYQHHTRINIMAFQAKSNALENKNICTFKMAIYNKENKH